VHVQYRVCCPCKWGSNLKLLSHYNQMQHMPDSFPQVRSEGDVWTHFWHAVLPSLAHAGLAICNKVGDSGMEGRSLSLCFLTPSLVSKTVQFVHSLLMREAEIFEKSLLCEQVSFFVGKEVAYHSSHIFYPIFGQSYTQAMLQANAS
jgi:hypothetical protein